MATFVLVHGAWHGGWCWHKVVARLEAAGHTALAPDLLCLGRDKTPVEGMTLARWVEQVCTIVAAAPEPVILVGHSRGGIVVTEVCEQLPERVRRVIYLAAFLPHDGQTMLELARSNGDSLLNGALVLDRARNASVVRDDVIAPAFYGDCSADDIALARLLLLPEPGEPMNAPIRATAARFGTVPRTYIVCEGDRAIAPALQRQMQSAWPDTRARALATDHSPFFSAPDALCRLLTEDAG